MIFRKKEEDICNNEDFNTMIDCARRITKREGKVQGAACVSALLTTLLKEIGDEGISKSIAMILVRDILRGKMKK